MIAAMNPSDVALVLLTWLALAVWIFRDWLRGPRLLWGRRSSSPRRPSPPPPSCVRRIPVPFDWADHEEAA